MLAMNSLQLWLAVLGGLVLAGVVGHGAWQTRRAGGRVMRDNPSTTREPTAPVESAGGHEPSFEDTPPETDLAAARFRVDEVEAQGAMGHPPEVALVLPPRRHAVVQHIDALIDGIATLTPESPVAGETVLAHLPPTRRAGGKPFLIEARNALTHDWEMPSAEAWYTEFQAGVQLANRLGPINEIEFSEFVQKVQVFADAMSAAADFPDMLDVVARGRELDAFASEQDVLLAMRLSTRSHPWPVTWVTQHAARHGFVAGATPGRLVLPGREEGEPPMLSLQFDAQAALADDPKDARVSEIALVFDVPQTPGYEDPFNAWCAAGHALALSLDAHVFDDQGRELFPEDFPAIGEELRGRYQRLAERELAAGSAAARRLFS